MTTTSGAARGAKTTEAAPNVSSAPRSAGTQDRSNDKVIGPEAIRSAIREINAWHPNTPLILVFSRQKKRPKETLDGGAQAVREVYDRLFALDCAGLADESRSYYLHLCHHEQQEFPFALRKPTQNYGKTHQRIIKDTFGQNFLNRVGEGQYNLREGFAQNVKEYLGLAATLDLRPLVLLHYWNRVAGAATVGDLWRRFSDEFGVDREPYDGVFSCTGLNEPLPLVSAVDLPFARMRQFLLPNEYGTGALNVDFWRRFRILLEDRLRTMKWQGSLPDLTTDITSALMEDQAAFLLGDPGTGKTTLVLEAILPALREAFGTERDIRFSYHTLTPSTSTADLFGFQGLDGEWIAGPLVSDLLVPYSALEAAGEAADSPHAAGEEGGGARSELGIPRLLFLDEANRVDIEGVLAPLQAAFDRLQKRMEPPIVTLGRTRYMLPKTVWRIFAGNSPASDSGRRQQSRPFKRRMSVVVPPDPMDSALGVEASFRRLCLDLLEKATAVDSPEIAEPATRLLGTYSNNAGRLEDLRELLVQVRAGRQVAVSVGLVESILLRASGQGALDREAALDAAVTGSLLSLVGGDRPHVEAVIRASDERGFPHFARRLRDVLLAGQPTMAIDLDSVL
jgi:MoxR-like ATPase